MTQLVYTKDELLQEHDYARPNQVGERRLHGGFDADGNYISPRTARRWEAVHSWEDALRKRGGEPLRITDALYGGVRFPTYEQTRLLIERGHYLSLWNSLTITGLIEARGAMLAVAPLPDLSDVIVEDVSEMAIGHLTKGLFVAHGLDEGGDKSKGIGAHDEMWFAARDLAMPDTGFETPTPPDNIGRPGSDQPLVPELAPEYAQLLVFLQNLLMIEVRAETLFDNTQKLMRDPALFKQNREGAERAAEMVEQIRTDEKIHVDYLCVVLGELREITFKTIDGGTISGREIVDRIWDVMVEWQTVEMPKLSKEQQRPIMEQRILAEPNGEKLLEDFNALETSA